MASQLDLQEQEQLDQLKAFWNRWGNLLTWALTLVLLALGYHHGCGVLLRKFEARSNQRGHMWFRWFNEIPVVILTLAVILVVVKPF